MSIQTFALQGELESAMTPEPQDSDNQSAQPEVLAWHDVDRRRGRQRGQLKQLKLMGKEVGEEFVNPGLVEDPGLRIDLPCCDAGLRPPAQSFPGAAGPCGSSAGSISAGSGGGEGQRDFGLGSVTCGPGPLAIDESDE